MSNNSVTSTLATASTFPVTTNNGLLLQQSSNNNNNLDHFKYIRSVLPSIPHVIETLSFTDLHNWECSVYVSLLSESDCLKWLSEFSDNTKTDWKVDRDSVQGFKVQKVIWGAVARCVPVAGTITRKESCNASLEMKILSLNDDDKSRSTTSGKQHPCLINISFYHNHDVQSTFASSNLTCIIDTFKIDEQQQQQQQDNAQLESVHQQQHIHQEIKDPFESFFLPPPPAPINSLSPPKSKLPNSSVPNIITSVNLSTMQPLSQEEIQQGQVVILPEQHVQNSAFHNEVFRLEDVSKRLSDALNLLQSMLNKSGTACAAVKQFTDHFERLKMDDEALEKALTHFGSKIEASTMSIPLQIPQWSMSVPTQNVTSVQTNNNQILATPIIETPEEFKDPKTKQVPKKGATKRKNTTSPKKPESTVGPGQIDPVTGKRRKRSRCGTCQGCINRTKTQDCRTCRNCMDQKRYGGPGRLKKACMKRSCIIMATPEGQPISKKLEAQMIEHAKAQNILPIKELKDNNNDINNIVATKDDNTTESNGNGNRDTLPITLPLHPLPVSESEVEMTSPPPITIQSITAQPITTSNEIPQAVLSWTNGDSFQVQQPIQFSFQPELESRSPPPTYAESVGNSVNSLDSPIDDNDHHALDTIAAEAARHHGIN